MDSTAVRVKAVSVSPMSHYSLRQFQDLQCLLLAAQPSSKKTLKKKMKNYKLERLELVSKEVTGVVFGVSASDRSFLVGNWNVECPKRCLQMQGFCAGLEAAS